MRNGGGEVSKGGEVRLRGQLICKNAEEMNIVHDFLPDHIRLTLAEQGCISFSVERTEKPLIWQVDECFENADAFHAHQVRVGESEWGKKTQNIERKYTITGLRSS